MACFTDGCDVTDRMHGANHEQTSLGNIEGIKAYTGGFRPEYGQAMSGIVSIDTKEGMDGFQCIGKYTSDLIMGNNSGHFNKVEGSLSGPLPISDRRLTYSLSAEIDNTDNVRPCFMPSRQYAQDPSRDYVWADTVRYSHSTWIDSLGQWRDGWMDSSAAAWNAEKQRRLRDGAIRGWRQADQSYLPHSDGNTYRLSGKVTYRVMGHPIKLTVAGFANREQYGGYSASWKYNLNNEQSYLNKQNLIYLDLRHSLGRRQKTFYTLKLSHFGALSQIGIRDTIAEKGRHWWQDYTFLSDADADNDKIYDAYAGNAPTHGIDNPYGVPGLFVTSGLGRTWEKTQVSYTGIKGDVVSQVDRNNQVQGGIDYKKHRVYKKFNSLPWDPDPFADRYDNQPVTFAGYLQDRYEAEGFILNAGLRLDYLDPRVQHYANQFDTMQGKNQATTAHYWSTRVGVAYPITERFKLRANVGRYVQQPSWEYLYDGLSADVLRRGNWIVGNPNLPWPSTIAYEIGCDKQFSFALKGDVTLYYKESSALADMGLDTMGGMGFNQITGAGTAAVRGVEFTLEQWADPFAWSLSYALSKAVGTASSPYQAYDQASRSGFDVWDYWLYYRQYLNSPDRALDWDQRHKVMLAADLDLDQREGPKLLGFWPLGGVSVSVVNTVASGLPYTQLDANGRIVNGSNGGRMPWTWNTDLKVIKTFEVHRANVSLELDVTNLFDRRNTAGVYGRTGLPGNDAAPLGYGAFADSSIRDSLPGAVGAAGDTIRYPNPNYSKWRDLNGDGTIDGRELYATYISAYQDFFGDPFNSARMSSSAAYQPPRRIKLAVSVAF